MESSAYRELIEKIERIADFVSREHSRKEETPDVWLGNADVMLLLGISRRTLQRLRDKRRITYAIFNGACRYHLSEVVRLVEESVVPCNPDKIEEFKRHYTLRTGQHPNPKK